MYLGCMVQFPVEGLNVVVCMVIVCSTQERTINECNGKTDIWFEMAKYTYT